MLCTISECPLYFHFLLLCILLCKYMSLILGTQASASLHLRLWIGTTVIGPARQQFCSSKISNLLISFLFSVTVTNHKETLVTFAQTVKASFVAMHSSFFRYLLRFFFCFFLHNTGILITFTDINNYSHEKYNVKLTLKVHAPATANLELIIFSVSKMSGLSSFCQITHGLSSFFPSMRYF